MKLSLPSSLMLWITWTRFLHSAESTSSYSDPNSHRQLKDRTAMEMQAEIRDGELPSMEIWSQQSMLRLES